MKIKSLSLLLAVLMAVSVLVGCGRGGSNKPGGDKPSNENNHETEEDRAIIVDRFKSWRFEGYETPYEDIPEFCYAAKKAEIVEKDYSLVPSRYIESVNRDESVGYEEKMAQLQGELKDLLIQEQQSRQDLLEVMKGLGYGIEL